MIAFTRGSISDGLRLLAVVRDNLVSGSTDPVTMKLAGTPTAFLSTRYHGMIPTIDNAGAREVNLGDNCAARLGEAHEDAS